MMIQTIRLPDLLIQFTPTAQPSLIANGTSEGLFHVNTHSLTLQISV